MGFDVTYSGTVSAAMEALIHGVPSLAVSLAGRSPANFATAGACTVKLLKSLIAKNSPWPQSKQTFLSVNVPDCPLDELKGWRLARQGRSIYRQYVEKSRDPWGQDYYWIGGDIPQAVPELGTDFSAVQEGYVSVTPLEPDLTARAYLDQAQQKGLGALLENWKG